MSATLKAIKNAATTTIQIGELWWQGRKVRSSDVARVGFAALAMADDGSGGMDPDAAMARMTPKQMAEITDLQAATVCAGTLAVSSDGEGWDTVTLVVEQAKEDVEAGVMCGHSLPPGTVEELFTEVMSLSTDKGAAAERLKSFLGEAGGATGAGHTGEEVREAPTRNTGTGPV